MPKINAGGPVLIPDPLLEKEKKLCVAWEKIKKQNSLLESPPLPQDD